MLKANMIYHIYRENSKAKVSALKLTAKTAAVSLSYSRLDSKIIQIQEKYNFFKTVFLKNVFFQINFIYRSGRASGRMIDRPYG